MHSVSGLGSVLVPDLESSSLEIGESHYRAELYNVSDYGGDDWEHEAVLNALTSKHPSLPLRDVEDLDVARFCQAKQDCPCHLRCPKH